MLTTQAFRKAWSEKIKKVFFEGGFDDICFSLGDLLKFYSDPSVSKEKRHEVQNMNYEQHMKDLSKERLKQGYPFRQPPLELPPGWEEVVEDMVENKFREISEKNMAEVKRESSDDN